MDPQLRHVRSFVAVAEELHFGRAALGPARELLAVAARLTEAGAARGQVTVVFVAGTLQGWSDRVRGHIVQLRHTDLAPALRRGTVDLAIARWVPSATDLVQTQIGTDGVVAAVPAGHRFASRESIRPAELGGEPMVALERRVWPDGYDAMLAALREQGIEPGPIHHTTTPAAALAACAAGTGIFRLAASAATPWRGVVYVPIESWELPVVLIRRPEPPRAAVAAAIAGLPRL